MKQNPRLMMAVLAALILLAPATGGVTAQGAPAGEPGGSNVILGFIRGVGGGATEYCNSGVTTSDGSFIIGGYSLTYHPGGLGDILMAKFDGQGTLTWAKTYGGSYNEQFFDLWENNDGTLFGAGYMYLGAASSTIDFLVAKFAADGTPIWSYTGGGASASDVAYAGQGTADGGYIVIGYTTGYVDPAGDILLVRLTSTGSVLWARSLTAQVGPGFDGGYCLCQASSGAFYIGGYTESLGNTSQGLIARMTPDGNLSWCKTFGGSAAEGVNQIVATPDGGFVAAGFIGSQGQGNNDIFVFRGTSQGSVVWSRLFGGPDNDYATGIDTTPDGGWIISASTRSCGDIDGDGLLIKLDSNGNFQWSSKAGGNNADFVRGVDSLSNGYFLYGQQSSFSAGFEDILMVRTNSSGMVPGCSQVSTCDLVESLPIWNFTNTAMVLWVLTDQFTWTSRTPTTSSPTIATQLVCAYDPPAVPAMNTFGAVALALFLGAALWFAARRF